MAGGEPFQDGDLLRSVRGSVLDLRQSHGDTRPSCRENPPGEVFRPGRRDRPIEQVHGVVDQDAARSSVPAAQNPAARRVRRVLPDAGRRKRPRVDPERVAVDPTGRGGPVGDCGVEVARVRKILSRPEILVPPAPLRPRARGKRGREPADLTGRLCRVRGSSQFRDLERLSEAEEMTVGIGPPRKNESSRKVHALRAGRDAPGGRRISHEGDLPVEHQDGGLHRLLPGGGIDGRAFQQQRRRRARAGERQEPDRKSEHGREFSAPEPSRFALDEQERLIVVLRDAGGEGRDLAVERVRNLPGRERPAAANALFQPFETELIVVAVGRLREAVPGGESLATVILPVEVGATVQAVVFRR